LLSVIPGRASARLRASSTRYGANPELDGDLSNWSDASGAHVLISGAWREGDLWRIYSEARINHPPGYLLLDMQHAAGGATTQHVADAQGETTLIRST
jgi:hypothetical protein